MRWEFYVGIVGALVLAAAHGWGLLFAPPEAAMGETGRILYLHVPTAWVGMLSFVVAFVAAIGALWSARRGWDALMEASLEVGIVYTALLLVQGSIWARPTWHVWWTWDPRLTTSAIMLVAFVGVLVLRSLVHRPERRMVASAVATIASFVNVPVVFFSVQWWRSQHQPLSSSDTVDAIMIIPLLTATVGLMLLTTAFIAARWRLARKLLAHEDEAPDLPDIPKPLTLEDH